MCLFAWSAFVIAIPAEVKRKNIDMVTKRSSVESPTRLLYPRKDAAYQLGISVRMLDRLIAQKKIAFQKIGRRVLIHRKELERFASKNHYEVLVPASKQPRT